MEVSHVLSAMGFPADEARGALRLSLGRTTTEAEIDEAVRVVPEVVRRLSAAPIQAAAQAGAAIASDRSVGSAPLGTEVPAG
jgi:hypothetical protein